MTTKEYYKKNKEMLKQKWREYYQKNRKRLIKNQKKYPINKNYQQNYNKEYRQKNKEILKQQAKEYRQKNREELLDNKRKHWNKNKEKLNAKRRSEWKNNFKYKKQCLVRNKCYRNKRYKNDKKFNIQIKLRARFGLAWKRFCRTYKLPIQSKKYPIDYERAILHLFKTKPKNINGWDIEHIIPLASFNLLNQKEVKKAFAPKNLQWLKHKDNLKKVKNDLIYINQKKMKLKKIRPTDINPSYSYHQGDDNKNERINFRHWNDLIYEKDKGEKDTTYSSLWLFRNAKEIPQFKDTIGSKSQTQAKKEGKEYFSEFNPLVAENIINFWSDEKEIVLDVFAGRTRGIVAGLKHRKYYGFEISPKVHKVVNEIIKQNNKEFDEGYIPIIYCDTSANLLKYNIPQADLIFSCPPYHNLEKYESVEGQLSDIEDYGKFLNALKEIMKIALVKLKENGFVCLVVGDFRREDRLIPFDCDVTKLMEELGVILWDKVILQNTNFGWAGIKFGQVKHKRQTSKVTEYLLVFKKIKK